MVDTLFPSSHSSADRITELATEVRRLWSLEPDISTADRERLFCELTEIDLRLHRLSIRADTGELDADEREAVSHCADRLDRLKHRWAPIDRPGAAAR